MIIESDWNVVQDNRVNTFNYAGENKVLIWPASEKIESIFLSVLLTQYIFSEHVDLG